MCCAGHDECGDGVEGRYGEVGSRSSMRGMVRIRRIAASGWAGGEWARAGWVDMLFSARMDGMHGPLFVVADCLTISKAKSNKTIPKVGHNHFQSEVGQHHSQSKVLLLLLLRCAGSSRSQPPVCK